MTVPTCAAGTMPVSAEQVEDSYMPSTGDLWNPLHVAPSAPVLVEGDPDEFIEDCKRAKARAEQRINSIDHARTLYTPERWSDWWFCSETWGDHG